MWGLRGIHFTDIFFSDDSQIPPKTRMTRYNVPLQTQSNLALNINDHVQCTAANKKKRMTINRSPE